MIPFSIAQTWDIKGCFIYIDYSFHKQVKEKNFECKVKQDFTFFKVKLSQLVHINFQAGENSHSYFFLCVEGMTEGLSRKVLLFEIIYVTFLL